MCMLWIMITKNIVIIIFILSVVVKFKKKSLLVAVVPCVWSVIFQCFSERWGGGVCSIEIRGLQSEKDRQSKNII